MYGPGGSKLVLVSGGGGLSSVDPTWSETAGNEGMAAAVAAFVASGTPTLVAHAEAGYPNSRETVSARKTVSEGENGGENDVRGRENGSR